MPYCAKCGARLEDIASFCSKCGASTRVGSADLGESITEALRTAGRELEAAFKTAGEEIDKAFREVRDDFSGRTGLFCPRCGERATYDAKFCFACGRELPRVG